MKPTRPCARRRGAIAAAAAVALACVPAEAQAKTHVVCYSYDNSDIGYFERPGSCAFLVSGADPISANIVDTLSLRWRNWGRRSATANGIQAGSGGYRVKAKVILSDRERCDAGFIYRRVRVQVRGATKFNFRLTGCSL